MNKPIKIDSCMTHNLKMIESSTTISHEDMTCVKSKLKTLITICIGRNFLILRRRNIQLAIFLFNIL
jgi:hypothetical protein